MKFFSHIALGLGLLSFFTAASWTQPGFAQTPQPQLIPKARWIEKTARTLRYGQGIGPQDDFNQLMTMDQEAIVDHFMSQPAFEDTLVDFWLAYFGRQGDQLRQTIAGIDGYHPNAEGVLQALWGARLVTAGEDFYRLYAPELPALVRPRGTLRRQPIGVEIPTDEEPPTLPLPDGGIIIDLNPPADAGDGSDLTGDPVPPNGPPVVYPPLDIPPEHRTPPPLDNRPAAEVEADYYANLMTSLEGAMGDRGRFAMFFMSMQMINYLSSPLTDLGWSPSLAGMLQRSIYDRWSYLIFQDGYQNRYSAGLVSQIRSLRLLLPLMLEGLAINQLPEGSRIHASDYIRLPEETLLLGGSVPSWGREFWQPLRNSSTNQNRKRAAYALETFFCDELTPIAVPTSGQPSQQHGSDAGCASCHYKLDPMAGLFRNHARAGVLMDPDAGERMLFDDINLLDRYATAAYFDNWRDTSGQWQVGYFTAPGTPHPQWQGHELADLWRFVPQAPETRQCLVRRLAEYFLGENRTYDGGWLREMEQRLAPAADSGVALKSVIKTMVLSQAFQVADPQATECYDRTTGGPGPSSRPPCAIEFRLQQSCQNCHNTAAPAGGLDLSQWLDLGDGFGFSHVDQDGSPLSRSDSFGRIIDRLINPDPMLRMPLAGELSDPERSHLLQWFRQSLEESQP